MTDDKLAEFAAKVSNDIHEGIDCKETRAQLRVVVSWWSMQNCVTHSELSSAKTEILLGRVAVEALLVASKRNRSKFANNARLIARLFLNKQPQPATPPPPPSAQGMGKEFPS